MLFEREQHFLSKGSPTVLPSLLVTLGYTKLIEKGNCERLVVEEIVRGGGRRSEE